MEHGRGGPVMAENSQKNKKALDNLVYEMYLVYEITKRGDANNEKKRCN